MATLADLNVKIGADLTNLEAGLKRAEGKVEGFGSTVAGVAGGVGTVAAALGALAVGAIKSAGEAEKAAVSFKVMLGSASAAQKTLTELKDFAANTPFEFPEVQAAAKKLLAMNTPARELKETLRQLGDVASGVDAPIGELADLFGRARVQGRLFAEDVNQLTGRGIPVIQEFAKQFGVTDGEVKKLVETGKIGFPELQKAFASLTAEGSKFGGLMAEQSRTIPGLLSNISDAAGQAAARLGGRLADALNVKGLLSDVGELLASMGRSSEDTARSFLKQRDGVVSLAAEMNPLLARYDELKGKTTLTKAEQEELRSIIEKVGKQIPTSIAAFDAYGKAMDINSAQARAFIKTQQEILAIKNKGALTEQREEYKRLTAEINETTKALSKRNAAGQIVRTDVGLGQAGAFDVPLTGEEIAKLQERLEGLRTQRRGVGGLIMELKGIKPVVEEINAAGPIKVVVDPAAAEKARKAFEKLLKARQDLDKGYDAIGARTTEGLRPKDADPFIVLKQPKPAELPDQLATLPAPDISPVTTAYENMTGAQREAFRAMIQAQEEFNINSQAILDAFPVAAFAAIGDAIGGALANGTDVLEAAAGAILKTLGQLAAEYGRVVIAKGIADIALGNVAQGAAEVIGGTALIAAGGVVSSFGSSGGGGGGVGSAPRQASLNPAAANGQTPTIKVEAEFKLRGEDLVAVGRLGQYRQTKTS